MGTAQENFCLRWNDFESNLATAFSDLRNDEELCDVSLATDDEAVVAAHKVVLSACSPHLKEVIRKHIRSGRGLGQSSNMLIYLRGVRHADLMSILEFMYRGSVNVAQEDLNSFLAVAEDLKVRGLTQNTNKDGTVSSKNGTGVGKRSKPSSATPLPAKKFRPSSQSSTPVAAAGSGPSSSTQHASSASSSGGAAPGSSHSEIQLKTEHHKDGDHDEDDDGGGGGGGGAGADDFDDTGDDWGGEAGTGGDSLGFEAGGGDDSGAGPSDLGKGSISAATTTLALKASGSLTVTSSPTINQQQFPTIIEDSFDTGENLMAAAATSGGGGHGGGQGGDLSDQIYLANEIHNFTQESALKMCEDGLRYQCLICARMCRDLYNYRTHMLTHMLKDPEFSTRIAAFVRQNSVEHTKQRYTCLVCRQQVNKDFYGLRCHFVIKHLKHPAGSGAPSAPAVAAVAAAGNGGMIGQQQLPHLFRQDN